MKLYFTFFTLLIISHYTFSQTYIGLEAGRGKTLYNLSTDERLFIPVSLNMVSLYPREKKFKIGIGVKYKTNITKPIFYYPFPNSYNEAYRVIYTENNFGVLTGFILGFDEYALVGLNVNIGLNYIKSNKFIKYSKEYKSLYNVIDENINFKDSYGITPSIGLYCILKSYLHLKLNFEYNINPKEEDYSVLKKNYDNWAINIGWYIRLSRGFPKL